MFNVQLYQVISPQQSGGTRYGIPVQAASLGKVYTGFVPLDTHAPFVLSKICACYTQDASTGSLSGPLPGFILPCFWEFRIWDEASGRQLFQANVNGIDDGFLPFSAFSAQQQIGQSFGDQPGPGPGAANWQPALMATRFYQMGEECEFSAGGLLRVDVRSSAVRPAGENPTDVGTIYISLLGFSHV